MWTPVMILIHCVLDSVKSNSYGHFTNSNTSRNSFKILKLATTVNIATSYPFELHSYWNYWCNMDHMTLVWAADWLTSGHLICLQPADWLVSRRCNLWQCHGNRQFMHRLQLRETGLTPSVGCCKVNCAWSYLEAQIKGYVLIHE